MLLVMACRLVLNWFLILSSEKNIGLKILLVSLLARESLIWHHWRTLSEVISVDVVWVIWFFLNILSLILLTKPYLSILSHFIFFIITSIVDILTSLCRSINSCRIEWWIGLHIESKMLWFSLFSNIWIIDGMVICIVWEQLCLISWISVLWRKDGCIRVYIFWSFCVIFIMHITGNMTTINPSLCC